MSFSSAAAAAVARHRGCYWFTLIIMSIITSWTKQPVFFGMASILRGTKPFPRPWLCKAMAFGMSTSEFQWITFLVKESFNYFWSFHLQEIGQKTRKVVQHGTRTRFARMYRHHHFDHLADVFYGGLHHLGYFGQFGHHRSIMRKWRFFQQCHPVHE